MRGPVLMLLALMLFAALDAAGKLLAQAGHGFAQSVFMRYALVLPMIVPLALWQGGRLHDGRTRLHLLRGTAMLVASVGFFVAFSVLPLAEGYLVYFTAPFMTIAAARLVLKETVPRAAWIWAGVGFCGVLIAVADGVGAGGAWHGYLAAFVASVGYAVAVTVNRMLRTARSMAAVLFWPALLASGVLVIPALLTWKPPDATSWGLMLVNGVFWAGATLCIVSAFRHAPASRLAPLEYTALLWALAIDWLLFGHPPAMHVLAGGAVVILACVMSERAQHR